MRELRRRGIATIDLKATFAAMPDVENLYLRTDTHWRRRAALLAYNMATRAIGHAEWTLDPATSLAPLAPAPAGDLARFLGMTDFYADADYELRLTPPPDAWKRMDAIHSPPFLGVFVPYAFEQAREGVGILYWATASPRASGSLC